MSRSSYQYSILPSDYKSVIQWAPKFIDFRLKALEAEPFGFSSSSEIESNISLQEWVSILTQPAFRVALCVTTNVSEERSPEIWCNEWAGVLLLYGPLYDLNIQDKILETRWYLGGGYVSPVHRGSKVLKDIFHHIVHQIQEVYLGNDLHRRYGFKGLKLVTRIEAIVYAWDDAKIKYYALGGLQKTQVMTMAEYVRTGWNIPIAGKEEIEVAVLELVVEKSSAITARL
ncbi:hypothetical protein TMatcc_004583 [Talaromyces marneffei ATCC 18224]|uniref:N-acetyltransferase domain-containing protein n=2 Tax=Talaromyces marneffei TaxID=37727 RepID=B6Q3V1_TALMQ|nr:uncharacterized protein EYB26_000483 [Talaromyces marneffei]EEA27144.1 hypothetical protein PMAA_020350 [Talaromyces marneffei ATCC 18224]KAE8557144.1 hypothetical protein EYB25_001850 [Talaromyces marneffei]QGA12838.1 hypothetical protein EYB26_000483 [Talaromyces marneffei]